MVATVPTAWAQTLPSLDGRWSGTARMPIGTDLEVEVVVNNREGHWRYLPRGTQARNNACIGKEFPITLLDETVTEVSLQVQGSKAMVSCVDFTLRMKRVDDKTLEGAFRDGRPVRLNR